MTEGTRQDANSPDIRDRAIDTAPPLPATVAPARSFGDVAAEYTALRRDNTNSQAGAIVVDRSARSRGTFTGAKARDVLTGLVTNDVLALQPGEGCYAAALTPKGKIIADPRIFVRTDDVLVDVPAAAATGWWGMIRKYVNPRLSRYVDVSADTVDLSVYGERAHAVIAAALGLEWDALRIMPHFAHRTVDGFGEAILVARVPDVGLEGYALIAPLAVRATLWDALVSHGARPAGTDACDIARIEAGRPEWGVEIDDATLTQEANMEALHAISFTKGCYTGQETVARVHFRGHVNRQLRGLRLDDASSVAAGAELYDATGKLVGQVRSVAVSPRLGGIAMAMVRREVAVEDEIEVAASEARVRARVVALPFPLG